MSDVDELDERHVEEIDFSGQYLNENMNPIKKIENMGSSNLPKKDPRKYGAAAKNQFDQFQQQSNEQAFPAFKQAPQLMSKANPKA